MRNKGRLLLVRHGQTFANVEQVWHGSTDTALTPLGEQQASELGQNFSSYVDNVDIIYASPLQRAKHTAQQIAQGFQLSVNLDKSLMEFSIGDWEGKNFDELDGQLGFFDAMMGDENFRAPQGETRQEATHRFVTAVEQYHQQHPGENIVVVAHGMVISLALAHWIAKDTSQWPNYRHLNTAVTELDLSKPEIVFLNRTDHLAAS